MSIHQRQLNRQPTHTALLPIPAKAFVRYDGNGRFAVSHPLSPQYLRGKKNWQ
jgi:hypothetical protein